MPMQILSEIRRNIGPLPKNFDIQRFYKLENGTILQRRTMISDSINNDFNTKAEVMKMEFRDTIVH